MEAESSIEKRTRHITSNTRRPPLETRPYLPGHTIPGFFFLSSQQRNNEKNENIRGTKTHRGKHSDMSIPFFFFFFILPFFFYHFFLSSLKAQSACCASHGQWPKRSVYIYSFDRYNSISFPRNCCFFKTSKLMIVNDLKKQTCGYFLFVRQTATVCDVS